MKFANRHTAITAAILVFVGLLMVSNCSLGQQIPAGAKVDRIVVWKSKRKLEAFSGGKLVATYRVALGREPLGAKHIAGDHKTPEGQYTINSKSANSKYHKNLGISYPNTSDVRIAAQLGKSPGGDIKIHGLQNGLGMLGRLHTLRDWTAGCIAISDAEIDELFAHTDVGTPVTINP